MSLAGEAIGDEFCWILASRKAQGAQFSRAK